MIRPMYGRVLVETMPTDNRQHMGSALKGIGLVTVDQKKHFDHVTLQGRVVAVGAGVYLVKPGDVIIFEGVDGFTTDKDATDLGNDLLGEKFRWLKEKDCLCLVEEIHNQEVPDNASLLSMPG